MRIVAPSIDAVMKALEPFIYLDGDRRDAAKAVLKLLLTPGK